MRLRQLVDIVMMFVKSSHIKGARLQSGNDISEKLVNALFPGICDDTFGAG